MITPKYVFNSKKIEECYLSIKQKLGGIKVFYALKANAESEVLKVLKSIGAEFEVASIGEFEKLREINVDPSKVICGLPVKPIECIEHLYCYGCQYFVFDMYSELNKLIKYAPSSKKILRININDLLPSSLDFGMSYDEIMYLIKNDTHFTDNINGLSFHISNNVDIRSFDKVMQRVEMILEQFPKKQLLLNIGGGYRIYAPDVFFENLNRKLDLIKRQYDIEVIAEPGNTIVNSSGVVQTKVIGVKKRSSDLYDVYIDAGKPSGIKTDEKRIPSYISLLGVKSSCEERTYRFIDITCMHRPHFSIKLSVCVDEGDIFEFGDMGAYTICLRSNFHLWAPPIVEII